jgi:hypothetical protein
MAKRKRRPIALFEVISKSRQYNRPTEAPEVKTGSSPAAKLLTTPKWWFKRATTAEPDAPVVEKPVEAMAPKPVVVPEPVAREAVEAEPADAATDVPEHHEEVEYHDDVLGADRAQTVHVAVDPERRQIALRMSFTAAIVGSFAVLVVVVLSVIVGQHMSNKGVPLLASSTTSELRAGPAHREVLDPAPKRAPVTNLAPQNPTPTPRSTQGSSTERVNTSDPHVPQQVQPAPEATRYIGLNYIVVQSYPESEEKLANDTAKFLNGKGIECTVVKGVKGFMACSVVTLQGFDKQSSPGFKNYVSKINGYNAEFTGGNRGYKAFSPVGKKWDKQE